MVQKSISLPKVQNKTLLFYVRDKVALDNLAPVIWSFSEVEWKILIVVTDHALVSQIKGSWWYPDCQNVAVSQLFLANTGTDFFMKLSRIRWFRWRLKRFVMRNCVRVVVTDWGE